nr:hypothetical protein [Nanoarchaeum sp.]
MKKFILILVLFLVLNFVSGFSLNVNFEKESYNPGDTLQADILFDDDIQGEILTEDIELNCNGKINVAPFLLRLEDNHYYSYFNIPSSLSDQNCSFILKDVIYTNNGFLEQKDFITNFSLNNTNDSVYVSPAAVRITNVETTNTFIVQVINNGLNTTNYSISTIQTFFDISKKSLLLNPGQLGEFYVYTSDVLYNNVGKAEIKLDYNSNSFSIPIFFLVDDEILIDNTSESKLEFVNDFDNFNITINKNNNSYGFLKFKNYGDDVSDINFELTGNLDEVVYLQFYNLEEIKKDETLKQYVYINQNKSASSGNYSGNLKIDYDSKSIEFPIYVEITDVNINVNNTVINNSVKNTSVKPDDKKSSISVWWFVGLFFVVIIVVFFLLYKKKSKKPKSFLKLFL